jgi:hypothetical protein
MATRKAAQAAALAQDRSIAELQTWIESSLSPVVRAGRQLLTCLNKPVENLSPNEVLARAGALARDDTFLPAGGTMRGPNLRNSGLSAPKLGLSQKIFYENFDIAEQIKWINDRVSANA